MKVRIRYSKQAALKFTGALDIQAVWQRSLRRADLSVEYSQGFHPQPKIDLPFPLPLGFTATNEIIDISFKGDYLLETIRTKLGDSLPAGIEIDKIEQIDSQVRSVASKAIYADYLLTISSSSQINCDQLRELIDDLLARAEIIRERNKKQYNLRPLILSIGIVEDEVARLLHMRLTAQPSMTGRPDEVAKELGLDLTDCDIKRLGVHFDE